MNVAIALVIAYLLGSIPSAYLAGKISRGIDLRRFGSGNLGATNAYRVLGSQLAALVWVADTAKGALPVIFLPDMLRLPEGTLMPIAVGALAIIGHVRPLFLGRGGGKGVATAMGVFLALAWLPTLIAVVAWCLVLWRTRYVSLASLVSAVALCVSLMGIEGINGPRFLAAIGVTIFVFWSHRENIVRLRNGEEQQIRGREHTADSSHGGLRGGLR